MVADARLAPYCRGDPAAGLSANEVENVRDQFRAIGAVAYLCKTCHPETSVAAARRPKVRRRCVAIMAKEYRVLIVDDHPIFRRGLANLIDQEADLEVCGEASDTAEALRLVESTCPDVAIIDLSLKNEHGLELIAQIRAKFDRVKMLVFSMHDELLFAERSLRAGAKGYVPKHESTEKLLDAIRQVLRGQIYLTQRMSTRLQHCVVGGTTADENPVKGLSSRELEVYEMIGQGFATPNIAQKLQLSHKTIERHYEKIKRKLNLKNSAELRHSAVQWVLERK
jgi:DNA-binding NarL/FixJ family response regulator